MKTKYIGYKSGLLIGLLSLNTLSSCVSTRQGLGMNDSNKKSSHWTSPKNLLINAAKAAVVAGAATAGYMGGRSQGYSQGYSDGQSHGCSNRSSFNNNSSNFNKTPGSFNSSRP